MVTNKSRHTHTRSTHRQGYIFQRVYYNTYTLGTVAKSQRMSQNSYLRDMKLHKKTRVDTNRNACTRISWKLHFSHIDFQHQHTRRHCGTHQHNNRVPYLCRRISRDAAYDSYRHHTPSCPHTSHRRRGSHLPLSDTGPRSHSNRPYVSRRTTERRHSSLHENTRIIVFEKETASSTLVRVLDINFE